ncbi:membrane protein [Alkalihalobacillus alcalophilus ATCC 27647 = CGMCC 1.3604]|uniref:Membrane protein n=1 Tax=Alkalihalobacillus alcalophilus ATCC 27647 = CGMCC 1.3604 TaxID=1218173 RepID=A0A094WS01_ALKAL|nr:metal-dependent hydrolase [Alkalihalobacillus alcalophilus]KGA98808.1 membrane protein [Alkalihalobacillus alcalophilus ATCC 27647 = CGMCC 1.3604]MED1560992.1 metal-dependent hydrolase [Alkalihalobacillus alcalophilus]THG88637.1 membrane protein [Alkalihalobacillus alcalophilus ATCC 27647 = CGMCC 1.3604]
MTGKTHLIGGLALSATVAQFTSYDPLALMVSGAVGGLLPDICHSGSKIGRRFPLLSKTVNTLFGHRTFTHSLLFLCIVGFLMNKFVPVEAITIGLLSGMISHFVLDSFTRNGIKFLYPLNITVRFPFTVRTGGSIEKLLGSALAILVVYFIIEMIWIDY